jgi:hypothetical protein
MAMPKIVERVVMGFWGLAWMLIAVGLAGLGLLFFLANTANLIFMRPADATVTEVTRIGPDSKRRINLTYQYTVDNQQQVAVHSFVKDRAGSGRLTKLKVGQKLRIYYWPHKPHKGEVLTGAQNLMGLMLFMVPFILICSSDLQFAFTGRRWLKISHGGMGIRIEKPVWVKNLMPAVAFSGGAHLMLSIIILPWRASVISGLILTFCVLPMAAWQTIKRSPPDSTASEK